jgi:prefoldin subunit 5
MKFDTTNTIPQTNNVIPDQNLNTFSFDIPTNAIAQNQVVQPPQQSYVHPQDTQQFQAPEPIQMRPQQNMVAAPSVSQTLMETRIANIEQLLMQIQASQNNLASLIGSTYNSVNALSPTLDKTQELVSDINKREQWQKFKKGIKVAMFIVFSIVAIVFVRPYVLKFQQGLKKTQQTIDTVNSGLEKASDSINTIKETAGEVNKTKNSFDNLMNSIQNKLPKAKQ